MIQDTEISSGSGTKRVNYMCITKTFNNDNKFHEMADKIGMSIFF